MADIVLTTLNARYAHASFGLRYLRANLGELFARSEIIEFDINQRAVDVLEKLLARDPKVVGLGVYIWNVAQATQLARRELLRVTQNRYGQRDVLLSDVLKAQSGLVEADNRFTQALLDLATAQADFEKALGVNQ